MATEPVDNRERYARIRQQLHPVDPTYSAEPLDVEDARWLLHQCDGWKLAAEGVLNVMGTLCGVPKGKA